MGNNQGKKDSPMINGSISYGGGGGNGIVGLVVFGGALAVAGFIAVTSFATNRNKTKGPLTKPNPQPQQLSLDNSCKRQHDHETEGICFPLQGSTNPTNDRDAECHGTSISQTSILEEKIDPVPDFNNSNEVVSPTFFHHQEIEFSDYSHPESAASSNDSGIEEGCLESLFNSHGSQALDVEPQESLKFLETETQDDDVVSKSGEGEDSSKATLDSKEEPVFWPSEQDFKGEGGKIDIQNEAHGAAKTVTDETTNGTTTVTPEETTSNEKGNFSVVLNDQPSASHLVQLTPWVKRMLLLALLLLLLLLIHGTQQSFSVIIP